MIGRRAVLATAGAALFARPAMADKPLYIPPEEAPHSGTFMMWPTSLRVYGDRAFLKMAQRAVADIANTIAEFEPVFMLADAANHVSTRAQLSQSVALWDIATEDLWARDACPLFAFQGETLVVSHIQFNGWGGKQRHRQDGAVARRVAERLGLRFVPSGLVGEPGGVEHDGHGLLMAHESSWINPNRNPDLTPAQITKRLLAAYGADEMIWSPGLYGEDITDYHIDSLARFSGPGRVLMNLPKVPDPVDPFHRAALETHSALINAGLEVEVIPEPVYRRVRSIDFVASYVNYYVCNGAVIAAQFGDEETDEIAFDALQRHYPGRDVIMLNVDVLGEIGGGIHCATQQMPAV